jgi:predicted O-methyltransferase YrrM
VALEVGSYLGASACFLVGGLAQVNGHLFCVDTWNNESMPEGERDTFPSFQANTAGLSQWITPLRKESHAVTEADLRLPLDLVFIDGDHRYPSVKRDWQHFSRWVAEKGTVVFHDSLAFEGVSRVIGEVLEAGRWVITGCVGNLVWLRRAGWSR